LLRNRHCQEAATVQFSRVRNQDGSNAPSAARAIPEKRTVPSPIQLLELQGIAPALTNAPVSAESENPVAQYSISRSWRENAEPVGLRGEIDVGR
jgi:hypothetical protein